MEIERLLDTFLGRPREWTVGVRQRRMHGCESLTDGDDGGSRFGEPAFIDGAETVDPLRQQPAAGVVVTNIDHMRYRGERRCPSKTCCF